MQMHTNTREREWVFTDTPATSIPQLYNDTALVLRDKQSCSVTKKNECFPICLMFPHRFAEGAEGKKRLEVNERNE
jgi:hypothetical protein